MRLIDADALKQTFCAECNHSIKCEDCDIDYHFEHLAPTVDAVPVVRCKDCIHKPRGTRNKHDMEFPDDICPCQCEDYWYSWMPYDDWFCANGERREDETN